MGKHTFTPTFFKLSPNEGRKQREERGRKAKRKIAGYHFSVADKRFGPVKSRYDRVYEGVSNELARISLCRGNKSGKITSAAVQPEKRVVASSFFFRRRSPSAQKKGAKTREE